MGFVFSFMNSKGLKELLCLKPSILREICQTRPTPSGVSPACPLDSYKQLAGNGFKFTDPLLFDYGKLLNVCQYAMSNI